MRARVLVRVGIPHLSCGEAGVAHAGMVLGRVQTPFLWAKLAWPERRPRAPQVLFNIAPVSYTSACTHASAGAVRDSVVPPGITMPDGVDPPALVRTPAPLSHCGAGPPPWHGSGRRARRAQLAPCAPSGCCDTA